MKTDLSIVDMLTRREIEARVVVPLLKAFIKEFGKERTLKIAEGVIQSLAMETGIQLAGQFGGNSIAHFVEALALFMKDNALQIDVLEQNQAKWSFNVLRCRYAEMYRELGVLDFCSLLSCRRDFGTIKGFNSKIELTRTKTLIEGADYCDFRYKLTEE